MRIATYLTFATAATATALNPFLGSLSCKPGKPGAVYYCSNTNFGGDCIYRPANDDCFAPPSAPMSIGPDKGGYCVLFEDCECKGSIINYDAANQGVNRVTCPGIKSWAEGMVKVGSMRCHASA
jgi:hypothetical protein